MIITRFAPSPTGLLHVGNVRTALVNWLFSRKVDGQFILRLDDTDNVRSKEEYADAIKRDLQWLGLTWDVFFRQSDRLERYEQVKQELIKAGRLYPCFESQEELAMKRKMQLGRGVPPIYDRAALKLSASDIAKLEADGHKPHYRFLLQDEPIIWQDMVRGEVRFEGRNLSDPILIREDSTLTYILSSVIDDIDYKITDIMRGEDHVTNTAIQIQIFKALSAPSIPNFAHLALIKAKDAEISKRTGGFDIASLREQAIEPMTICSLFSKIGTSMSITPEASLDELAKGFDLSSFGRAPAIYEQEDLLKLNHKILAHMSYTQVMPRVRELKLPEIDEQFWLSTRANITKLIDLQEWWNVCKMPVSPVIDDAEFLNKIRALLPDEQFDENSWSKWLAVIKQNTDKTGKALFMPIRRALTGKDDGPELKFLLPLIGRERVIKRLQGVRA